MRKLLGAASAAALSICLIGTARAQDSRLTYSVQSPTLQGSSTAFNIDLDKGDFTIVTDGGVAHFMMVRAQGTLKANELQSLVGAFNRLVKSKPPASLPGVVMGAGSFTLDWSDNGSEDSNYTHTGSTGTVTGSSNVKGAIEEAKQRGLDTQAWDGVAPLIQKLQALEPKLEKDYQKGVKNLAKATDDEAKRNPGSVVDGPDLFPFQSLSISLESSWGAGTDSLSIDKNGNFKLTRSLGQSTITGTLTGDQERRIESAYKVNVLARDNGKTLGKMVPDGSIFTVSATEGGKSYTVKGFVDGGKLGPLETLEKALLGTLEGEEPPAAAPRPVVVGSVPPAAASALDAASSSALASGKAAATAGIINAFPR